MTSSIAVAIDGTRPGQRTDWVALARELGPGFAARAAALDANDSFPVDNYRELKEAGVFGAGVPAELGGGGASHRELCGMLRELGRHCGATALALSMHTHLVGTTVWLWRQGAPVAPMLERIAGSFISSSTRVLIACVSARSTRNPVTLSSINSGMPPTRVATTGFAWAIASAIIQPKTSSQRENWQTMSAA